MITTRTPNHDEPSAPRRYGANRSSRVSSSLVVTVVLTTPLFAQTSMAAQRSASLQEQPEQPLDAATSADPVAAIHDLALPAGELLIALDALASRNQVQLVYRHDQLRGVRTAGATGRFTVQEAVLKLLEGTELRASVDPATGAMLIAPKTLATQPTSAMTDVDSLSDVSQEVVVTGTYLRNSAPITPVVTISREVLAKRGYTSIAQVMEQLPQNFTAGVSPSSNPMSGKGVGATSNQTFAAGINLRGLGPSATLVLLNGRRLAPAAYSGFADISQIPVNIIDRIEILSDGASGLYGSDAVAGVVNIITVQDYSGVEIQARETGIGRGKSPDHGASALGGISWEGGNGVLGADYQKNVPLLARNRSFTGELPPAWTLTPESEAASIFASARHALTERMELSGETFFTKRDFGSSYVPAQVGPNSTPWRYDGDTKQYNASLQLDWAFAADWRGVLIGQASKEEDRVENSQPFPTVVRYPASYRLASLESRVDGALFDAPGGRARLALGGQFRDEKFAWSQFLDTDVTGGAPETAVSRAVNSRQIRSAYAELSVPLIGSTNAQRFAQSLRIDLSGRYDDYSDFGHTSNPKVGIEWAPFSDITLHGSYARSFKAPTLFQLSEATNYVFVLPVADPRSDTGSSLVLLKDFLANPDLQPETARSYNFGLTYKPESLSGLQLDASYFSVDFSDRIVVLISQYFTNVLEQEAVLGSFVRRDPSVDEVNAILNAGATLRNWAAGNFTPGSFAPGDIRAIADVGSNNAAVTQVRGIDLSGRYRGEETAVGRFAVAADASYFTRYDQKLTSGQPPTSVMNTLHQPLRFRSSLNVGWERNAWAANVRLNFSNGYSNNLYAACATVNNCDIASWTTVDFNASYTTDPGSGWLDGIRLGFTASNLFDRAPPRAVTPDNNLGYDSVNANPLLRMVGLTVAKRFGGDSR